MSFKTLIFIIIALFLLACGKNKKNDIPHIEPQCLPSQSQCVIETTIGDIEVLFDKKRVLTEVPFHIFVKGDSDIKLVSAKGFLEGKEMFMGRVPVLFDLDQSVFKAETLLGSCSEEQMIWLLWLTIDYQEQNSTVIKQTSFNIEFTSFRN